MEFWKESFETPPFKEKRGEKPIQTKKSKIVKKKRNQLPAFILLIFLISGISIYLLWPRYELIALGSFGGPFGSAESINNSGQIAGWSQLPTGFTHAFICDPNSKIKDIGTLGGKSSYAKDLNDKGQVVGYSENSEGSQRAFIWDNNTGMKEIILPQAQSSEAVSINNNGQVVGYYKKEGNQRYAFFWDPLESVTEIVSPYDKPITPNSINDKGQVAGNITSPDLKEHAFYWDKESGLIDIVGPDGQRSAANCINNNGKVAVNIFVNEINSNSGFLWDKESGLKNLKISKIESNIYKINDTGQLIGYVRTPKFLFIPKRNFSFFRTNFGLIVNLNKSGKSENDTIKAEAINNNNWIVGQIESQSLNPQFQPILLKPEKNKLQKLKTFILSLYAKKIKGSKK